VAAPLSLIRNSQAKPQVELEDSCSKEGPQHWSCLKPEAGEVHPARGR